MIDTIHVWPQGRKVSGDEITVSAEIVNANQSRQQLWYRFPARCADALTESADPFVLGALFRAMRASSDLVVHGRVSPSLLRNLEEFQALWACWQPSRYSCVEITADIEEEAPARAGEERALAAFSGGVDSCFTIWRHKNDACGRLRRDITAGVMVHGFDIPLDKPQVFSRAVERSSAILESVDIELIAMASNYRSLGDYWGDAHGAAVASCLMMLQGGYTAGLVGSTWTYDSSLPWGSSPVGDWMLSNRGFECVHDGAAFSRADKIEAISAWPEVMENLRVCWAGEEVDRNCCRCEKCIRTILNFRVLGYDLPACFDHDVTDQQILDLSGLQVTAIGELQRVLDLARARGIHDSWVTALERCTKENLRALEGWTLKRIGHGIRRRAEQIYARS